jgi:hypothetical protein
MMAKPLRKPQRSATAKLDLPGPVAQTVSLQEQLDRATAYMQAQNAACASLQQHLHEAKLAQWTAVSDRLVLDKALREANAKILMLQTMADSLHDRLRQQTPEPVGADQAWLVKELTRLLSVCHPDKWQNSPVAEELTKEVLKVRQRLQGTGAGRKGARR